MSFNLPLHPATVHWPFAFLTAANALDLVPTILPLLPQPLLRSLPPIPPPQELARISYYALTLGLVTALPAVFSGVAQAVQIVGKQGLYEADGRTVKPKFKTLAVHALAADTVVGLSAYAWWHRDVATDGPLWDSSSPSSSSGVGRALAAVALGLGMVFAAHEGGKLAYEYGMGMTAGKKSKSK